MRMPIAKTIAPPTTTCNDAVQKDVPIQRLRIQAIANSSTTTTIVATIIAVENDGIRNGIV